MAVQAWPFAGPNRPWGAVEWRQFMVQMRQPGVLADVDGELLVDPVSEELQSVVRPGTAFIAGHQVVIDDDETVAHDTADLEDDRIDLVVLTTDWTDNERSAYVEVLTGTPAASPEAPTPTQDDVGDPEGVWQEPLAEVLIVAAAGETGGHTDLRSFMETPGRVLVVASLAELDGIDPTWHRFAVVDPDGEDAVVVYYDVDAGQWVEVTQNVEVSSLGDLSSLDADSRKITSLANGTDPQDAATKGQLDNATTPSVGSLASSGSVAVDMAITADDFYVQTLDGDPDYATSNREDGSSALIEVVHDSVDRSPSFPSGWLWLSEVPETLEAGGRSWLSLFIVGGTAESNVRAAWVAEEDG